MNLSGESVRELVDYYKVDAEEEVLVIYDTSVWMSDNFEFGRKEVREDTTELRILSHISAHRYFRESK